MDRIEIDQALVDQERATNVAAADAGEDDDLPAEDRRNRAEVCPGSPLKRDDDVLADGFFHARVIGPARGSEYFLAYSEDLGPTIGKYHISGVTDRAPADPNEQAMPVWTPPEPPAEPEPAP